MPYQIVNIYPTSTDLADAGTSPQGAATRHECVDDPVNSEDFLATRVDYNGQNITVRYGFGDIGEVAGIAGVELHGWYRSDGGNNNTVTFDPYIRVGGANYLGTTRVCPGNASWAEYVEFWALNPATLQPWTRAEVNVLIAGQT